jgi:hypothetical protein
MPHPDPVNVRQPGVFHDFVSVGVSEPVLRLEREQPRDHVFEAVPPDEAFRPFVIQYQYIVEYRLITISLEWLDTKTHTMSENPFRDNHTEYKNCGW